MSGSDGTAGTAGGVDGTSGRAGSLGTLGAAGTLGISGTAEAAGASGTDGTSGSIGPGVSGKPASNGGVSGTETVFVDSTGDSLAGSVAADGSKSFCSSDADRTSEVVESVSGSDDARVVAF